MKEGKKFWIYFLAKISVLVLLGALIYFILPDRNGLDMPPAVFGAFIILLVGVLLALMFIFSAGFNSLNLSDPSKALGMPEGSIRAFIAISLIVVFVAIGIYVFHIIAVPLNVGTLKGLTLEEVSKLQIEKIPYRF